MASPYAQTLLEEENISYLKAQVEKAEEGFRQDGRRFFWEWYIIYALSTLIAGYLVLKYGIAEKLIGIFKATSLTAKLFLGSAVFSVAAMIGGAFTCICKIIKTLLHRIFG